MRKKKTLEQWQAVATRNVQRNMGIKTNAPEEPETFVDTLDQEIAAAFMRRLGSKKGLN